MGLPAVWIAWPETVPEKLWKLNRSSPKTYLQRRSVLASLLSIEV